MAETRGCEQCGTVFTPRREHARFCSPRCRVAWNRAHAGGRRAAAVMALEWSLSAMQDSVARCGQAGAWDAGRAAAAVSEAVWWVTLVDATLVRYYPGAYDAVLASQEASQRRAVEGTLAGLRFVRNQMGYQLDPAEFLTPGGPGAAERAGGWAWQRLPAPPLGSLPAHARRWEQGRYRAYQAWLAGHTVTGVFGHAAAFLKLAFAHTAPPTAPVAVVPAQGK